MSSMDPELYLYNLTLNKPFASIGSIVGYFTNVDKNSQKKRKYQELIIATNSSLHLYRLNPNEGKLIKILEHDCFSVIRAIDVFRVPGGSKDCVVLTSDSGNLTLLTLNQSNTKFEIIHNEPYAKTGLRRITPGEYISVDGKNRAMMISAIEKNKLIYILNRDSDDSILISSPLEANKSKNLTFFTCGLDVGYDNPLFVSIECNYEDDTNQGKKFLNYYQLDLGLNHVLKKYSEQIPDTSNYLLSIPGGADGPSGVLLCSKNLIQYKFLNKKNHSIPLPRRRNANLESFIISGIVHKMKGSFFILLQNNLGDLFKITIDYNSETIDNPGDVNSIEIQYFDTLPITKKLLIFKSGFLFADSENSDKYLYQFEKLGDDDENAKSWNSTNYPDEESVFEDEDVTFDIKSLDNLGLVDILESINPVVDTKLLKLPKTRDDSDLEDIPTLYSLCGTGARSSLKILNHEILTNELVSSELPADAQKVFTTKLSSSDEFDKYLVLSFVDGTLVLSIGETVEEVTNSGFSLASPTVGVQQLGTNSVAQIHSNGIRYLTYDKNNQAAEPNLTEWFPPAGIKIQSCSSTSTQIILGLSNRELVYFELDEKDELIEFNQRVEMSAQILSLSLGDLNAKNKLRSKFLAVGTADEMISILSCDPDDCLEVLSTQLLSSQPSDLMIMEMANQYSSGINSEAIPSSSSLYLHIGMKDGIYARVLLDERSGEVSDSRRCVIGTKPVKLAHVNISNQNMIMIFSSRTFIGFNSKMSSLANDFKVLPLKDKIFTYSFNFKSEDCQENGCVGVYRNNLTIFTINEVANDLLIESIGLRYTPKKMCESNKDNGIMYVIESDYNITSPFVKEDVAEEDLKNGQQIEHDENEDVEIYQQFGYPQEQNKWGSCIQVVSTIDKSILQTVELINGNQAAFSLTQCTFKKEDNGDESEGEDYLIVGVSSNQTFLPNGSTENCLLCFKILSNGLLKFIHKTKTDSLPLAMTSFQNKLLIGLQNNLILYDLGLKQLLRKSFASLNCKQIVKIEVMKDRVVIGDIRNSIIFLTYTALDNKFIPFIEDVMSRHITTFKMIDYDTVIGGDKFGNIFLLRCSSEASDMTVEDNHGTYLATKEKFLNGAPYRLNNLCNFYLQDIPTSFNKGQLSLNSYSGSDSLIYTGLQGTIGILLPMVFKSEITFFVKLQNLLREELAEYGYLITGRDNLKYRSYYSPTKGVIDGDLIEKFSMLNYSGKSKISKILDRTPKEVEKKIIEMRLRVYF
ncbi:hypothetical protein PACTADRAFT_49605 [Pachysolen tannophilus NRRL Y-2460]|uniref:DNA damage-binding protein 1 n=1 Tax=Pachysolen tannophilus NRRL Y-2460 TaxID=669874 RepID=A0A1E4TWT5_PACTA|nr:hypothetical protein PACTADRAFT_49605 [Pachysolen tannophilus NRRL Y-2460]